MAVFATRTDFRLGVDQVEVGIGLGSHETGQDGAIGRGRSRSIESRWRSGSRVRAPTGRFRPCRTWRPGRRGRGRWWRSPSLPPRDISRSRRLWRRRRSPRHCAGRPRATGRTPGVLPFRRRGPPRQDEPVLAPTPGRPNDQAPIPCRVRTRIRFLPFLSGDPDEVGIGRRKARPAKLA